MKLDVGTEFKQEWSKEGRPFYPITSSVIFTIYLWVLSVFMQPFLVWEREPMYNNPLVLRSTKVREQHKCPRSPADPVFCLWYDLYMMKTLFLSNLVQVLGAIWHRLIKRGAELPSSLLASRAQLYSYKLSSAAQMTSGSFIYLWYEPYYIEWISCNT